MTDDVVVKDFSKKRPRIFLDLDGERYEARSAIGLPTLQRVQQIQRRAKDGSQDRVEVFGEMFEVLLKAESAERFLIKLKDEDEPVDPDQLQGMITYLMEIHAARPTGEPSALPGGSSSEAPGTASTDGVQQVG